jgi:hypothetical protein
VCVCRCCSKAAAAWTVERDPGEGGRSQRAAFESLLFGQAHSMLGMLNFGQLPQQVSGTSHTAQHSTAQHSAAHPS